MDILGLALFDSFEYLWYGSTAMGISFLTEYV